MIDGAKIVCGTPDSATARSARALARMKRVRLWADALWALKKTKRLTPAWRAACTMRQVATPLSSSIDPPD
jgi:hypothetical protein